MEIQRELLLYLWEHKDGDPIAINTIFEGQDVNVMNLRTILGELSDHRNKIIYVSGDWNRLGGYQAPTLFTLENTPIKAKLTPVVGQKYVRETYLTPSLLDQSRNLKSNEANKKPTSVKNKLIGIFKIVTEHPIISGLIVIAIAWVVYGLLKKYYSSILGIPLD